MIAGYIIAAAGVEVLGPSVLAVFTSSSGSTWTLVAIATGISLLMLVIAIVGIRITARTQVGMAAVEYVILIGFAIVGLIAVLHHHPGTFPITKRHPVRQRGDEAPAHQPGPCRHSGGRPADHHLLDIAAGPAGSGGAEAAPGALHLRARVRRRGAGRSQLVQGDGAVPRAVGDRRHPHEHRAHLADHLRDGELPDAAGIPGHRVPPVCHPGRRQHRRRATAHRAHRDTCSPTRCRARSTP